MTDCDDDREFDQRHGSLDDSDHRLPDELSDEPRHRTTYDPNTDSISEELVQAVATINDADVAELPILADVIDPEALDELFQARSNGRIRDTRGNVVFHYEGHRIRVTADGVIELHPVEQPKGE